MALQGFSASCFVTYPANLKPGEAGTKSGGTSVQVHTVYDAF